MNAYENKENQKRCVFSGCEANIEILRFVVEILTRCLGLFIVKQKECLKLLPYAGGAILFFVLVFAIWVRSVPPKPVAQVVDPLSLNQGEGGTPEFMGVDTDPIMKERLEKAIKNAEAQRDANTERAGEEATPEGETGAGTAEQTIEL